jgi:hypothetical protein
MTKFYNKLKNKLEVTPKYHVIQPLSFPVYTFDLNDEVDPDIISQVCRANKNDNFIEKSKTSIYAWRSDYLYVNKNKIEAFDKLFKVVHNKIEKIWKNNRYTFCLDHYWFAFYNENDYADTHDHGWVDLATVYYAHVSTNSAPLIIPSPQGDVKIQPKKGMLVVMNGNCSHSVPKINSTDERIIVAINVIRDKLLNPVNNSK